MPTNNPNVNVTLNSEGFEGKLFPCPVCGTRLQLRVARTAKPYCHCDACGIQLFFRGAKAIQKLRKLLQSDAFRVGTSQASLVYNRLQQLKEERRMLESQQGLIFRDADLDQAIGKLDAEISAIRQELKKQ